MSKKLPKEPRRAKQYGMDMSLPGAAARWREILAWVYAEVASDDPGEGGHEVPKMWKPRTKEERVEEGFLRRLLLANTAQAIGGACCPAFSVKEMASSESEMISKTVDPEEAFRLLAMSFKLSDREAHDARRFADAVKDKGLASCNANIAIYACAKKFRIIRQAVEVAERVARLSDRQAVAESAAENAIRKVAARGGMERVPSAAIPESYPWTHGKLTVENEDWTQYRYQGRLFDLGCRHQAARVIRVMLLELKAVGRENAKPEKDICISAKVNSGQIRSPFSAQSGKAKMCREFCSLVIINDKTRRRRYYLDI